MNSLQLSKIVINPMAKRWQYHPVILVDLMQPSLLSTESWKRVGGKWPSSSVGFSLTDWLFKMYQSYLYSCHGILLMVQVDDV